MGEIIRLLTDNPVLLILLVMWILSALGGVFTRAARKAEQQRRKAQQERGDRQSPTPQRRERQPTVQRWPEQERRWADSPGPAPQSPSRHPRPQTQRRVQEPAPSPSAGPRHARPGGPRSLTPEEAAAQIRRLMGMEPEPAQPTPEPAPEPPPRQRVGRELGGLGRRHLDIHVDSHVGEKLHDRHLRRRRSSLAPDRPLPSSTPAAPPRRPYELSELRNLPKAFVLREILGPPKAMQDEWPW